MLQDFSTYRSDRGVGIVVGVQDPIRERQYDVWWRTVIAGPTRNTGGAIGNDFPGAYLHDPVVSLEHFLFFHGALDWRHHRAELRVVEGSYVLGVWGPGTEDVTVEYEQQPCSQLPTRWEALTRLITWSQRFLPDARPDSGSGVADLARRAFANATNPEISLLNIGGQTGHLMYVRGTSEAWSDDEVDHLELLAQSDIAWGLALLGSERSSEQDAWLTVLVGVIGAFWSPAQRYFSNIYPHTEERFSGGNVIVQRAAGRESTNVWYQMYNHARLAEIAVLVDVPWRDELREAVDHTLELAERAHYRFPLFWWLDDAESVMRSDDAGSAGAYAWLMIRAFDLWNDERYLDAAKDALEVLHRSNIDDIYGESVVIARAAWSSHELHRRTGERHWAQYAEDFTAATLRMMYWSGPKAGMFQACAAMLYPAFFENVGVLLALDPLIPGSSFDLEGVLRRQLPADLDFFDGLEPAPAIPHENISTVEYPFGGRVGKELYAVGEVLQLPYLAERLAGGALREVRSSDRSAR